MISILLHTIQTFDTILWDSFKQNTKYGTILIHSIISFLLIMITPRVTIFDNVGTPAMSAHGVQTPVRPIQQILRLVNPSYSRGKHFLFSVNEKKSKCTLALVQLTKRKIYKQWIVILIKYPQILLTSISPLNAVPLTSFNFAASMRHAPAHTFLFTLFTADFNTNVS